MKWFSSKCSNFIGRHEWFTPINANLKGSERLPFHPNKTNFKGKKWMVFIELKN